MRTLMFLAVCFLVPLAQAHSGRTNSQGCHNDNIRGGYHCHNGGTAARTDSAKRTAPTSASVVPYSFLNPGRAVEPKKHHAENKTRRTCEQIKSAGKAPIAHWEPEYHKDLDLNGNGWGCEVFEMDARVHE